MWTRRAFLQTGMALAAPGDKPLRERAAARGVLYGAAASYPALNGDAVYATHFAAECGILVPENALKWGPLRPTPEQYNFQPPDWLADFAAKYRMKFRGHTLVWHNQLPGWFAATVTKENARGFLEGHIRTVASRYRGRMHSWDVVNEAIDVKSGRQDELRKTPWLDLLGPEYIEIAFSAAKSADPEAMLTYNEYGVDYDAPGDEAKRAATLRLLRRLQKAGTPVKAFGCQAHLNGSNSTFRAEVLKRFFGEIADMGLKILTTELDVKDNGLPEDFGERDLSVAHAYEDYLAATLSSPAVIAVLTWGLSDRYTWLTRQTKRDSGTGGRVLPLDRDFRRKPVWDAMARAFDRRGM